MASLIENKIAALIEQSHDIAKQVRLENWDSVDMLTTERQLALEDFFNQSSNSQNVANNAANIESMIRKILEIDHGLITFIENEKKQTFNNFANLKSNNNANKTYQNVAALNIS